MPQRSNCWKSAFGQRTAEYVRLLACIGVWCAPVLILASYIHCSKLPTAPSRCFDHGGTVGIAELQD